MAKAILPIWKISQLLYSKLQLDTRPVEDVFPEDYVELYYKNVPLISIYSLSLSSILESSLHKSNINDEQQHSDPSSERPMNEIELFYRLKSKDSLEKYSRDFRCSSFCPICLSSCTPATLSEHRKKCELILIEKALEMPDGIYRLLVDEPNPLKSRTNRTHDLQNNATLLNGNLLSFASSSDSSLLHVSNLSQLDDDLLLWTCGDTATVLPVPIIYLSIRFRSIAFLLDAIGCSFTDNHS